MLLVPRTCHPPGLAVVEECAWMPPSPWRVLGGRAAIHSAHWHPSSRGTLEGWHVLCPAGFGLHVVCQVWVAAGRDPRELPGRYLE